MNKKPRKRQEFVTDKVLPKGKWIKRECRGNLHKKQKEKIFAELLKFSIIYGIIKAEKKKREVSTADVGRGFKGEKDDVEFVCRPYALLGRD